MAKGMMGEHGMSPRKSMAMGKSGMGGESFGVSGIEDHQHHGGEHPDAGMSHNPLEDHERGIGHKDGVGIKHHEHMHAAQAAPHHGHTHPGGHMKSKHHGHGKGHKD